MCSTITYIAVIPLWEQWGRSNTSVQKLGKSLIPKNGGDFEILTGGIGGISGRSLQKEVRLRNKIIPKGHKEKLILKHMFKRNKFDIYFIHLHVS